MHQQPASARFAHGYLSESKRRTIDVRNNKLVTQKFTPNLPTVFIIDSTSASLETSPPKVMAWPPDASICKNIEILVCV